MSKVEEVSLRIFGRDLTIACPPKEKNNLIKAASLLNEELDLVIHPVPIYVFELHFGNNDIYLLIPCHM